MRYVLDAIVLIWAVRRRLAGVEVLAVDADIARTAGEYLAAAPTRASGWTSSPA